MSSAAPHLPSELPQFSVDLPLSRSNVINQDRVFSHLLRRARNNRVSSLPAAMDYSASIHDPDHPAEASPWGSSPGHTPEHSRTSFPAAINDYSAGVESNGLANESEDGGFGGGDASEYQRPDTASTANEEEPVVSGEQNQGFQGHAPVDQEPHHHQEQAPVPSKTTPEEQQARRPAQPQFKLQAKITGLERSGRKDPIMRFDVHVRTPCVLPSHETIPWFMAETDVTQTNIPSFRTTQYRDVRRLHSEFVKLAEHLISANPEAIVPAIPPSLTSAGAGTDEDEARVKGLMQRWLNYVCSNEVLMRDEEMVLFVESDFGYSPLMKKKQPATGVRRKILKQFAPPPDDTPQLQEARPIVKLFYLGTMDAGHKVDKLVKSRRGRPQSYRHT